MIKVERVQIAEKDTTKLEKLLDKDVIMQGTIWPTETAWFLTKFALSPTE